MAVIERYMGRQTHHNALFDGLSLCFVWQGRTFMYAHDIQNKGFVLQPVCEVSLSPH